MRKIQFTKVAVAFFAVITTFLSMRDLSALAPLALVDPETALPLGWDPGTTHEGTRAHSELSVVAGDYYFKITTANPSLGAWRTALKVLSGEAHLYMSRGVLPTATVAGFRSERTGSDGFVVSSTQFAPNEVWYILVRAAANSRWTLVSGAPFVQDLGTVAADDSSGSGEVVIGPEGIRFFSARIPSDMLAWRLWLNGATNAILLKKTSLPLIGNNELTQNGHALVVPPYLAGQQYFIGIPGIPGETNRLDSRQQPIASLAYGGSTTHSVTGFPYTTYRIQVPPQQIAWQIAVPATLGNPNVSVRRNMAPNENYNDALSDLGATLTDSIALVPPILSDGTFYVTVWSTNAHAFTLRNGPEVVTEINYVGSVKNDDPTRAGWRYYRVTDINQQLGSLGWSLSLTNFAPGTRIALRRNAAPGIWSLRNPALSTATYHDLISLGDILQHPGHQADVWYVGVYNPTNALGNFTLTTREINPGPLLDPWQTARIERTNVPPGIWEYFRLELPEGGPGFGSGLGWDLRLQDVTGSAVVAVRRDAFPDSITTGFALPINATNWPSRTQWAAAGDWTARSFPNVGTTNENGRILTMGVGRPLQPGRYYIGVQGAPGNPQPVSFTLVSRWIGEGREITVRNLNWTGDKYTNTVAPREVDYYRVVVPPDRRSFKVRLRTLTGEAMLVASKDTIPNVTSTANSPVINSPGKNVQKLGDEYLVILPPRGTNVVAPGTYYIGVVGEGQNPPDGTRIGVGNSTYILETLGEMPEPHLGVLGSSDLVTTGSLAGGDVAAYHFATEPDILGFWVFVEDRIGNPVAVSRPEIELADPGLGGRLTPADPYGNDGGGPDGAIAGTILSVSNPFPIETIMVKARQSSGLFADASYTLRVSKIVPQPLPFDGGLINIAAGDGIRGNYFYVDVPPDAIGWDLRITNVTSGNPQMIVSRDFLPGLAGGTLGFTPNTATNWPPGAQWLAGRDWIERPQNAAGVSEDGRILAMGMGRPLEPGRYYVAITATTTAPMTYSLSSRGIGTGFSIPIRPLDYNGGSLSVTALPPREAAYFRVDVPANAPSWKVRLSATSGEALLIAAKDTLPNVLALPNSSVANSAGRKIQKTGDEYFLLLPPNGSNSVLAATYYLAVVGEGVSPQSGRVGAGTSDFTVASLGAAPVQNLGQLGFTDLVESNSISAGDTRIYQFTVPPGTLGLEARLEERVGNPVMVLRKGSFAAQPGAGQGSVPPESYGNENGENTLFDVSATLISLGNVTNDVYTLVVMARSQSGSFTNASYTLRLNASGSTTLNFDDTALSMTDQVARTWKYFRVVVPTNAAGWDVRLVNVSNGLPRLVIRRDSFPSVLQTTPWGSPGVATAWPTNSQWAPGPDWTRRTLSFTNSSEEGRVFAAGMGRPLEAGTYYVGVYNNSSAQSTSYTIQSRGIGPGFSIPLVDVPFTGSFSSTLPAREAAYFRVIVPSNAPSWKVKLTGESGESMMVGLRGGLPNIDMNLVNGTMANGRGMQKAGNEHFVLLPVIGQTNLPASTNYFVVVSEGVNPPSASSIGSGSSSFTFESQGAIATNNLGLLTSEDIVQSDLVEAGEIKLYQFLIPPGMLGFKVRLENRVGNPTFVLRQGGKTPEPGAAAPGVDSYGNEGGYTSTDANTALYTVPNPIPGVYTLVVKGRPLAALYPDASYSLRLQEMLGPELNFSGSQNTNGLSHTVSGTLDDNERIFYKVVIPATDAGQPVVGWKLDLVQSSGLASMRVRRDTLPADANSAAQMQFTTAAAIIVPPFLTNGVWYVEVKGTGSTAFTLTSSPLLLQRPVWLMPAPGESNQALGVLPPLFGDSGVDTNGTILPGDASTFLEQGSLHYYAVSIPASNFGVLRAALEAVSGNPDLYLRYGAPPTLYHNAGGTTGTIFDRSMLAIATEYANWVPADGKLESRLKPGLWYIAVRAAGNANARYRLKLSIGNIVDIPVHGPALANQLVAGGDWRYYRLTAPSGLPGGFNLTFSEESGDVFVHVRDTIPPGNGATGAELKDWINDNKNHGPYLNFNASGTYSFATPPIRPGTVYYFGVRAASDSVFTLRATTNGAPSVEPGTIAFYGGLAITNLLPGEQAVYRIDVPPEATRWKHTATHAAGVQFSIEQGTLPTKSGTDDFRNGAAANNTLNQYLLASWPWVPGQSYFLIVSNPTALAQEIVFSMDGRNAATDDNDSDSLPDAWELQYFGNTTSQISTGDADRDGVTNIDEFAEGTNPNDPNSLRTRLLTTAVNGTIVRSPNAAIYSLNEQVTLTAAPAPGYAFIAWTGTVTGRENPVVVSMDRHQIVGAMFKLSGDDFVTAIPLAGNSVAVVGSNVGMSKEPGEPNHAGNPGGKSIWWRWTAPSSGPVTVTTAGTPFNTVLGIYRGSSISNLTSVASDNNSGGVASRSIVRFDSIAGTVYHIAVDGYNGASSRIDLSLATSAAPNVGPELELVSVVTDRVQIRLAAEPNRSYSIETTVDLVTWTPLGQVTTDSAGNGLFNATATAFNRGFYRTRN